MWKPELGLGGGVGKRPKQNLEFVKPVGLQPGFSTSLLFQHPNIEFQHRLSHRGGGRGYFAVGDILPGELVLMEAPGADIPAFPEHRDPSERCLLNLASIADPALIPTSKQFLENLQLLHPQSLDDISPSRLADLKRDYAGLLGEMQTLPSAVALGLDQEPVLLRHLAALHFNGFTTGVYLYLAMVNHSCAPNCIKWGARDGVDHSEVRATRKIAKGEEITFSYLVPLLRSRTARRRALHGQFGFDCTCELCDLAVCPPALETGLEQAKETLELVLEQVESGEELIMDAKSAFAKVCKARNEARIQGGLGPRSLALAHADVVIIEASLVLLEDGGLKELEPKEMQFFILALLTKAFSVRKTQLLVFAASGSGGEETNCESETTLQHISSGIGYFLNLMNGGLQVLTSLKSDEGNVLLFASKLEAVQCQNACVKASKAIAALYS
ncbi:hypothetical protein BASA81_001829 [Batrachochytrium salamandrivorans]|nr:hypothetical protein BASA81_001829 [Batrachochytrium salamandrivorans]